MSILLPTFDSPLLLEEVELVEHVVPGLLDLFPPLGVPADGAVHLPQLS